MTRALVLIALAACGPYVVPPESHAPIVAALIREECLEGCPHYAVVIYADGTVQYDGVADVDVIGRRVGHIDAAAIAKLREEFARSTWLQMGNQTGADDCTDQPWQRLTFEGRTIVIDEGHPKLPDDARILPNEVDWAAGTDRWTGNRIRIGYCGEL